MADHTPPAHVQEVRAALLAQHAVRADFCTPEVYRAAVAWLNGDGEWADKSLVGYSFNLLTRHTEHHGWIYVLLFAPHGQRPTEHLITVGA